jgi:hypothetical protein
LLLFLVVAAVALVPWIGFLLVSLPDQYQTRHWRLAWVGFDVALVVCLASAAWLGWRRRRAAVPLLVATAALLCCDAWFDVVLDWNSPDRWLSLATAVLVEIPIAVLLAVRARSIVAAGVTSRELTVHDIEVVLRNPSAQRLLALAGKLTQEDVALAGAQAPILKRIRAKALAPKDLGPAMPELPCAGTRGEGQVREAFVAAAAASIWQWAGTVDPADEVRELLKPRAGDMSERARLALGARAEVVAKQAIRKGSPAAIARARRLCVFSAALEVPGGEPCEAIEGMAAGQKPAEKK